jgi:hypothetical protein
MKSMLKISTFKVDCTPPENFPIGFGMDGSQATIRDPLYLRGLVLDNGESRALIASLDYCGLMNSAYDHLVAAFAQSIGAPQKQVVVHCVHQHDTPLLNFELADLLGGVPFPLEWWTELVNDCAMAAKKSLIDLTEAASVGHAEQRLFGFASNRRILGEDGKVRAMRFSRSGDESLKSEPVGTIDPMLRTLAFRDFQGDLLCSMSFYATHPQVSNGRQMYSADAEGEALNRLESDRPDGLHLYFSGPFGNVTAGKYSSSTDLEGNVTHFGEKLATGILRNLGNMSWENAETFEWVSGGFPFPREDLDVETLKAFVRDEDVPFGKRIVKAAVLSSYMYGKNTSYPVDLLKIGTNRLLFLSGEPFVEYQLYAQSLIPDEFIASVANCNDNFLYLPLAENFPEEGYEVTSFRWCTPDFESRFKKHIASLLT